MESAEIQADGLQPPPTPMPTPTPVPTPGMSRARSVKNLLALGLSFVLMFTSYQGLSAVQSSFNTEGGLGTAGLAVTYASIVASSLAVAPLIIGWLGPKRTMTAALCGYVLYLAANFLRHWDAIEEPPMYKFYTMMGCFLASGALSVLVMLLLVDRTDSDSEQRRVSLKQLRGNVAAMLRHMADWRQVLLLCLTVNVGLSQSFAVSDFTEGFVACSSGIGAVGRVMMCYGAGQVVSGVLFGLAAGRLGKVPVLLAVGGCQIAMEIAALFWWVQSEPSAYFFCYAFAWGCVDTVWNSQMNALYGEYFADRTDAAFSAYRFFESLGYILGFSYNKLLCINQKLGVMLAMVSAGCLMLIASALLNRRMRKVKVAESVSEK